MDNPIDNRVGGFESNEDPYVFDVRPVFNQNNYVQGNVYKKAGKQNGGLNDIYYTQQPGKFCRISKLKCKI